MASKLLINTDFRPLSLNRDLDFLVEIAATSFPFPRSRKQLTNLFVDSQTYTIVAEPPRYRPVAFISWQVDEDSADVVELAVHFSRRRKGIGRELIAAAADRQKYLGTIPLSAIVPESNIVACRFYAACGWHATGVLRGYFELPAEDGYRFEAPR